MQVKTARQAREYSHVYICVLPSHLNTVSTLMVAAISAYKQRKCCHIEKKFHSMYPASVDNERRKQTKRS
jgi:hypothetical protein